MINNNNTTWNQDYYNDEELQYLSKCIDGTFLIDSNGFVNVNGDVDLYGKGLTTIPFKFGKVTGKFWCLNNQLTSLRGCPYDVGESFNCSSNNLESLEYAPKYIGGSFWCNDNNRIFSKIEIRKYSTVIGDIWN